MAAVNALHPDRKVRGYSQNRGRCATRNWTPPPAAHARPPLLRAFLLNRSPPRKRGSSAFAMFADPAQEELDSRLRGNERRLWFRPHTADSNVKQPTLRRPYCLRPRLGRLPSPLSRGQVSPSPSRGDGAPIGATLLKFAPSFRRCRASRRARVAISDPGSALPDSRLASTAPRRQFGSSPCRALQRRKP